VLTYKARRQLELPRHLLPVVALYQLRKINPEYSQRKIQDKQSEVLPPVPEVTPKYLPPIPKIIPKP
jgi:hypothetical protein